MSKLIDSKSAPSTKTELDLFQIPPTQIAVEDCFWKEVQLTNGINNEGPYEFHIAPNPQMLQLSKNYLLIEFKIVKEDDTNLAAVGEPPAQPLVGPINLIGSTFIKQVKVFINGSEVSDSGDKYAYRAFIETELNYGKDAKESLLQAALYIPDTPPDHIDDKNNTGLQARSWQFQNSAIFQVMAPLHCDIFAQNRFMLNQVDLRVQIYRNSDAFCLMRHDRNNYKIKIENMRWYIKAVDVQSSANLAIEKTLQHHTAKYPVRRVEVKTLHIAAARQECPQTPIFSGQIPRRLILGLVSYGAYIGNLGTSPFNFKPFNIQQLSVTAGGKTTPFKPLNMDFPNNKFMRAFVQLFEGIGMADENKGNAITLAKFKSGSTMFAFDLSPDEDDGGHWDLAKDGAVYINMLFSENVPAGGIELIAYAEFDNLITIDRNRNPYTDYKA
jgi:hypothetical protein